MQAIEFEPITFIISTSTTIALMMVVYWQNRQGLLNRLFLLLSATILIWMVILHLSFGQDIILPTLFWIRLSIVFAIAQCFIIFIFAQALSKGNIQLASKVNLGFIVSGVAVGSLTFTKWMFSGLTYENNFPMPAIQPALFIFDVYTCVLLVWAVVILGKKYKAAHGLKRQQLLWIMLGVIGMYSLILGTIALPVLISSNVFFVPFHSLYALFLLGSFAIAITRYRLFGVAISLKRSVAVLGTLLITAFLLSLVGSYILFQGVNLLFITILLSIVLLSAVSSAIVMKQFGSSDVISLAMSDVVQTPEQIRGLFDKFKFHIQEEYAIAVEGEFLLNPAQQSFVNVRTQQASGVSADLSNLKLSDQQQAILFNCYEITVGYVVVTKKFDASLVKDVAHQFGALLYTALSAEALKVKQNTSV